MHPHSIHRPKSRYLLCMLGLRCPARPRWGFSVRRGRACRVGGTGLCARNEIEPAGGQPVYKGSKILGRILRTCRGMQFRSLFERHYALRIRHWDEWGEMPDPRRVKKKRTTIHAHEASHLIWHTRELHRGFPTEESPRGGHNFSELLAPWCKSKSP
jgi:hypothetical protein